MALPNGGKRQCENDERRAKSDVDDEVDDRARRAGTGGEGVRWNLPIRRERVGTRARAEQRAVGLVERAAVGGYS